MWGTAVWSTKDIYAGEVHGHLEDADEPALFRLASSRGGLVAVHIDERIGQLTIVRTWICAERIEASAVRSGLRWRSGGPEICRACGNEVDQRDRRSVRHIRLG